MIKRIIFSLLVLAGSAGAQTTTYTPIYNGKVLNSLNGNSQEFHSISKLGMATATPEARMQIIPSSTAADQGIWLGTGAGAVKIYRSASGQLTVDSDMIVTGTITAGTEIVAIDGTNAWTGTNSWAGSSSFTSTLTVDNTGGIAFGTTAKTATLANLDLEVGTDIQAYSTSLTSLAATPGSGLIPIGNGTDFTLADAATVRSTLGLATSSSVTFGNVTSAGDVAGVTATISGAASLGSLTLNGQSITSNGTTATFTGGITATAASTVGDGAGADSLTLRSASLKFYNGTTTLTLAQSSSTISLDTGTLQVPTLTLTSPLGVAYGGLGASFSGAASGAMPYYSGGTFTSVTSTSYGRSILAAASDSATRSLLGLGTAATKNAGVSGGVQDFSSLLESISGLDVVGNAFYMRSNGTDGFDLVDASTQLGDLGLATSDDVTFQSATLADGLTVNSDGALTATYATLYNAGLRFYDGSDYMTFSRSSSTISLNTGTLQIPTLTLTNPLTVPYGGTGASALTSGKLLKGNGTSAVSATSYGLDTSFTDNGVLVMDTDTNTITNGPDSGSYIAGLTAGTGITIDVTSGAAVTSEIATVQDIATSASPTFAGLTVSTNGLTVTAGDLTLTAGDLNLTAGEINFPDDVRQNFFPGTNNAGLNVGNVATDPSNPLDGDIWFNTTTNTYKGAVNGGTVVTFYTSGNSEGGVQVDTYTTTPFTWTKPTGATRVRVILVGGGGGGGGGGRTTTTVGGGGGGGAGGWITMDFDAAELSATEAGTVGGGGDGGYGANSGLGAATATAGVDGTAGGASTFKGLSAPGGLGGKKGTSGTAGTTSSTNTNAIGIFPVISGTSFAGAAGGTTATATTATATTYALSGPTGGGGGGGGSSSTGRDGGAGGNIVVGTTVSGGTAGTGGGAVITTAGTAGGNGSRAYSYCGTGGGGGGGGYDGNGGAGGNGGNYGAGGGGGGGALYVSSSIRAGQGGDGANGIVVIITYFQ